MNTVNSTDPNQLLSEYVESGSELAFREIVSLYVDLVYSVALRRLNGNEQHARDVVQTVFIDLARKAGRLRRETSLGGWLHHHTCFVTSTLLRHERRRQVREQEAFEMNREPSESLWQRLAPELDEAIDQLGDTDRRAILLRFYERREIRVVGAMLGSSEVAAQKRISRALEKLRGLLSQRGVSLSVAALGGLLANQAVSAAPPAVKGLADSAASVGASGKSSLFAGLIAYLAAFKVPFAVGTAMLAVIASIVISKRPTERNSSDVVAEPPNNLVPVAVAGDTTPRTPVPVAEVASTSEQSASLPVRERMRLTILSAENDLPLAGVAIKYTALEDARWATNQYFTDQRGVADIAVARASITQLQLSTVLPGFADTLLQWRMDREEVVPDAYTLRMVRAARISGLVVDADRRPVSGATVGFNHLEGPNLSAGPESHEFGWIEATTASDGRWEIDRIAPEMLRWIHGSAKHPDYADSPFFSASEQRDAELQMRNGTHVFQLGRLIALRGFVFNPQGQPVANARVFSEGLSSSSRRDTTSQNDGSFTLAGGAGRSLITAEAAGYVSRTIEADFGSLTEPVRIVLQTGSVLRLRIVDRSGQPVPAARVWYDIANERPTPPLAQIWFATTRTLPDSSCGKRLRMGNCRFISAPLVSSINVS